MVISASQQPGKDSTKKTAVEVIEFIKSKGKEVRFSPEDSFGRWVIPFSGKIFSLSALANEGLLLSDPMDLLGLYKAVDSQSDPEQRLHAR